MSKLITKVVTGISTLALAASMLVVPVSTTHAAMAGEVYKTTDGTVWFITSNMQRRPFTSWGAFMSYGFLSGSQIKEADSSVNSLSTGSFIAPQDGRIFCATVTKGSDKAGECALITGGKKARFTSANVFTGQGYSFARSYSGDSSFLENTTDIDNASAQHRPGTLINNNGTVQLVVSGGLWGVPSMDVFNSWGWSFADVVPANSADLLLSQTGVIPARMAGDLVPTATSNPGGDDDDGNAGDCNLEGNAGDITVTQDSTYSNEEVGENEEEVGVLGFEVEADDDSDIAVTSVKIEAKQTNGADSQDLEDYVSEVQIMYGDEVVGTADAEDFTENSDIYTKSISLDCAEVMAGETGEFAVAFTAQENLDSADIDSETFQVELMQVRFEDGDGVTTTEPVTADTIDEPVRFVDFSTAADVELNVSLNDEEDSINDAHNVIVEDDQDTDDESILAFTLEAEGDSDIMVMDIPVTITGVESGADDLDTIISSADLYHGDTKLDSQNVSDTVPDGIVTVTFEDLDLTIDAGDTEEFTVKVNILELEGNYSQGTTLQATVVTASIDAEDEEGDDLSGGELTGSAVSEDASLFSNGITVEVTSATTDITETDVALGDVAEFSWELEITNVGDDDVYINADNADVVASNADAGSDDGAADAAADVDSIYTIQRSGTNALTATFGTIDSDEDAITADASAYVGGYSGETFFRLDSGESITVNIVVSGTNGTAAGQVRAFLAGIEWTTDDITAATAQDAVAATINSYTANLAEDSETPYRPIN